ncbi:MAG TPA: antibiotic biosynthesis monooxygenase [Syntrophobacteria bacterium]|jgi:heme-degrading monooxygenase HmoA|nr:antibiotic biosynthesis monooxygenase [Syntrophobacteria bacterium]
MAIRILIERKIIPGNELLLNDLLMKLRTKAMNAKGYISGETLRSLDDVNTYVVISTWNSLEEWKAWTDNKERKELQARIDALLKAPATHRVYAYY